MEANLIIVGGRANKKRITVKLPTVIGRSREADLTIAHPMVSRQHCELFEVQGLLRIRDLGSLNGTLVGEKQVKEASLRPNDQFTIGPLTFRVDYEYAGDPTATAEQVPDRPAQEVVPVPQVQPVPAVAAETPFFLDMGSGAAGQQPAETAYPLPDFSAWERVSNPPAMETAGRQPEETHTEPTPHAIAQMTSEPKEIAADHEPEPVAPPTGRVPQRTGIPIDAVASPAPEESAAMQLDEVDSPEPAAHAAPIDEADGGSRVTAAQEYVPSATPAVNEPPLTTEILVPVDLRQAASTPGKGPWLSSPEEPSGSSADANWAPDFAAEGSPFPQAASDPIEAVSEPAAAGDEPHATDPAKKRGWWPFGRGKKEKKEKTPARGAPGAAARSNGQPETVESSAAQATPVAVAVSAALRPLASNGEFSPPAPPRSQEPRGADGIDPELDSFLRSFQ